MPRDPRRALIAAACAALVAASVTACGGNGGTAADTSETPSVVATVSSQPPPSAPQSSSPQPSSAEPSPTPTQDEVDITIAVAGGTVTPSLDQVPIAIGDRVRLAVTSDVVDDVHVHGLDLTLALEAGAEGVLDFEVPADFAPGVYEVEMEGSGLLLFMMEIR